MFSGPLEHLEMTHNLLLSSAVLYCHMLAGWFQRAVQQSPATIGILVQHKLCSPSSTDLFHTTLSRTVQCLKSQNVGKHNVHILCGNTRVRPTHKGSECSLFPLSTAPNSMIYKLHLREQHSLTHTHTHSHQKPMSLYKQGFCWLITKEWEKTF